MALPETIFLGLIIVLSGHIHSVFSVQNVCKTYGTGVFETFNKTAFHLKSTCPIVLTHFTHSSVDCHIIVQRGPNGLMDRVEIIVNKVVTLIHNNTLTVEGSRISLPYDHTYQHVFRYGIYTKFKSKVLPLSVTWYSVSDGVSSIWVQLDQNLVLGMGGLCGHLNSSESMQQLISENVLSDGLCLTQDSVQEKNTVCQQVFSDAFECLGTKREAYKALCYKNMYGSKHKEANCSFFKELSNICGSSSPLWKNWRSKSNCPEPQCPGDLKYMEMGPAFPPTCTNPQSYPELTSTCHPPEGKVVNDRVDTYYSIDVEQCPCVHGKTIYAPGQNRTTKCQTCTCVRGIWVCSANTCPFKCIIEGQLITTFDGKQYSLLDRCTYVAARGLNWTLNIQFSGQAVAIEKAFLNINQERYTFSANNVELNNKGISELSQTEYATVFWQSSMFIQVQTSFGLKMQVQVSPEIQIYLYLPTTETSKGLCGTNNNDTRDDFTTFSGIIESSVQLFAQSWSMDSCVAISGCINSDNEIYAEDACAQLRDPNGVFAACHDYVPVSFFLDACIQRTCQCSTSLEECLCVSLGNYAKACVTQGIAVQDWRSATHCYASCEGNLIFGYSTLACNHTCRSLSGPDPTCEVVDDPVEGCGCTADTHLNDRHTCSPRPLCNCHHSGGIVPPGPVVVGGRQCMCENGQLQCPEECDCPVGKICVHCSQIPVKTAHRTCESLTKPLGEDNICISGCYCPEGLFQDHNGACVTHEDCTCEFSGTVYETGQSVETNCKRCTCRGGEWSCIDAECSGVCEVFGNGQYRTFDSKWYRFDGHCQYTLVKDVGSNGHEQFAIKTETVPCCDESLTCSRSISVELWSEVTLLLSDMEVTSVSGRTKNTLAEPLYSIHIVGLYIIISVPTLGLTVIWDKHTRVTIQLGSQWRGRVLGLCGNFDGKVTNDLLTSSSSEVFSVLEFGNSWKTAALPCTDVTNERFPCERHSYCAAWAQRRCMILRSDTFKDCHLKVDPEPYYQACVLESCSCEFEGKFLGFCSAVSAYSEACNAKDICINWRTPDLCPVYCDYYNEADECTWHYNACGQVKTCGTNNQFKGKLEGCYPRCPAETPYYDENTGKCSSLDNCTCKFMNKLWPPQDEVCSLDMCCKCLDGIILCKPTSSPSTGPGNYPTTAEPSTTAIYTSPPQQSSTTMNHTTIPLTTESTKHLHTTTRTSTATTQPPTLELTTEYETTVSTGKTTESYTTQIEHTTQIVSSVRTTKLNSTPKEHTTITQPSTTERYTKSTTELNTTPVEQTTTTEPLTSNNKTEFTTTTTTMRATESNTPSVEYTTSTQLITNEMTTNPTTTSTERTTEFYSTLERQTTTTEPSSSETTTNSHSTPLTHTTTTQPPTSESTTDLTTTERTTKLSTAQEEHTTGSPLESTTTSHSTLLEPTTTTQTPTSESTTGLTTTERTTKLTTTPEEHKTVSPFESTTTSHSTLMEPTTTTQPPTSESTTDLTTTERTTKLTTTPEEHTTASPFESTTTSHSTLLEPTSTTQPPTSESTTELTTTERTTKLTTTPEEHTTASPLESTTTSHSTLLKPTTTTQLPTSESTTELTSTKTEKTTKLNTTPGEHTTTTVPPTTKTHSTTKEHTTSETTVKPTTTEGTTELYTNPIEQATTTQTSTLVKTTESYTPMKYTSITQPTTIEQITTTQQSNTTTDKIKTFLPSTVTQSRTLGHTTHLSTTAKEIVTTQVSHTTPMSTVTTTEFTVITAPTIPSSTHGQKIISTTIPPECRDVLRNQSWPNGATWREDCADKVCRAGVIEVKTITCPTSEDRTDCPRGMKSLVKDKDTCCESWQCDCQCRLYGDPHYISFQGISFDFMDNCTYTLVEEKTLLHHLSIVGDNYFCEEDIDASCSKGITLKYWNDTATLMVTVDSRVESTLNQEKIDPPFENEIFKFERTSSEVFIYIKPIRSYVSLTPFNTLLINLAREHFLNNTQGQCGVCGGQSCIRRNGVVEEDSCCDKTAYDWVVQDPLKPYCKSPPRNIPCISPPPMPPSPPCIAPICDLLHHDVFAECNKSIDLGSVERNCRFDQCSSTTTVGACSSLEYAASACKTIGICVDWRNLTNGSCEFSCPKGMIYDECRQSPNAVCQGSIAVPASTLVGQRSGCFCPVGQILADEHKQICVTECTKCKGPLGEPMPVGAVWESNCHICTCNSQTKTEECHPKPPLASPMCSAYSVLVSDCCNNEICVEKTCEHNGTSYNVGDRWTDPLHPCESFSCTHKGTEIEKTVCPQQTCAEDLRIWDKNHCCFSCNTTCAARLTRMNITVAECTQEVELPSCEGRCESQNRWVQTNGTLLLEKDRQCCKESAYEMREVTVTCNKRLPTNFAYKHVKGCECKSEM